MLKAPRSYWLIALLCVLGGHTMAQNCTAGFNYIYSNCPEVTFLDYSFAPGDSIVSWDWDFGDGTTSTLENPVHTFGTDSSYAVCLSITTASNCTSHYCDTLVIDCINNPTCQANFYYTYQNCPNYHFYDSSSAAGQIGCWFWEYGDGGTDLCQNAHNKFPANGIYTVCLWIMTADNCVNTYCDTVHVNCVVPSCEATFTADAVNAPSVNFTSSCFVSPGTVMGWDWDFGDGNTSTAEHPMHTYSNDGNYEVCLTITTTDSCAYTTCDSVSIMSLGVTEQLPKTGLQTYPNPAGDWLNVQVGQQQAGKATLQLLDLTGKLVLKRQVTLKANKNERLNIAHIKPGTYLLKVTTSANTTVKKLMISR